MGATFMKLGRAPTMWRTFFISALPPRLGSLLEDVEVAGREGLATVIGLNIGATALSHAGALLGTQSRGALDALGDALRVAGLGQQASATLLDDLRSLAGEARQQRTLARHHLEDLRGDRLLEDRNAGERDEAQVTRVVE